MKNPVKPVPDEMPTVVNYLCVRGAARAIEFYAKAFGARETMTRITDENGKVGHAELQIGNAPLMLADEHPEHGFQSPETLGGSPVLLVLNVPDCDAVIARAVAAGGRLTRPIANQFYGDRNGEVTDPFGYRWFVTTHVEDVAPEELQRRAAQHA